MIQNFDINYNFFVLLGIYVNNLVNNIKGESIYGKFRLI